MRTFVTISLALALTGLTSAAWPGNVTDDVLRFEVFGGGLYSPAYLCDPEGHEFLECSIEGQKIHYDLPALRPATVVYTDPSGTEHQGSLRIKLNRYQFSSTVAFRSSRPGFRAYEFHGAEGRGEAEATWSMTFPGEGGADSLMIGTLVTRPLAPATQGIRLDKDRGQARLRLRFQLTVTQASGPLTDGRVVTGDCASVEDCFANTELRFTPTRRQLENPPFARAIAAKLNPEGRASFKVKEGKPRIYLALPRNGLMTSFGKHHLVGSAPPNQRCTVSSRPSGSAAGGRSKDLEAVAGRTGHIDFGPPEEWAMRGPDGRAAASVTPYQVTVTCSTDRFGRLKTVRTVKVKR